MTDDRITDRRQFVHGTATVGTALSLAGCSLFGGDSYGDGSATDGSTSPTSSSGGPISIGDTVQGTLTEAAPNAPYQDKIAVPYTVEVAERQRVRISHESDEFDTYLILADESGAVVRRNAGSTSLADDEPPGDDSLLMPLLSPGETYTIWAGKDGFVSEPVDFTLSVGGPSALTGDAQDITLGEAVTTDADVAVPDPHNESQLSYPLKVPLRLELREQKRVGIDGANSAVVTDERVVPVTAAEGRPSGNHRISVDGRNIVQNSRVDTSRPEEGVVRFTHDYGEMTLSPSTYIIWAEVGETVTVREPIPVPERIEDAASISPGETVTGELTEERPRDPRDHFYAAPYTIDGSAGQLVHVDIDEHEFLDPWLLLTDSNGNTITDGGSHMPARLPEDDTYVIWVRSQITSPVAGTLTGEFDLSVREATIPDEARTVSIGDTVTAEITADSPRDPVQNDLAIPFVIEGEGSGTGRVTQESEEFEPQLSVSDGTGEEGTRHPALEQTPANVAGVPYGPHRIYVVWAGSEPGTETGTFRLSVEEWDW